MLFDNVYYASHNENDNFTIEHMVTKVNSSVTLMSEQLNSRAESDRDSTNQDSLLIKE